MSENHKEKETEHSEDPSLVFTPELVNQAKAQWQKLSPLEKLKAEYVRWIVLCQAAKAQAIRQEIASWLHYLPNGKRDDFRNALARLKPEAIHVYHELAVRHALSQLGYKAEYERKVRDILHAIGSPPLSGEIMDKTPDWFVYGRADVPPFLLDVHTAEVPGHQPGSLEKIYLVKDEIEKNCVDAELTLQGPSNLVKLPGDFVEKVSQAVGNWLTTTDPDLGGEITIDCQTLEILKATTGPSDEHKGEGPNNHVAQNEEGATINFQVRARRTGHRHVKVVIAPRAFYVDIEYLFSKVQAKVGTYAAAGLPLVVAVVADPRTGLSLMEFEDAVLGERFIRFEYTNGVMEIQDREPNGIFAMLSDKLRPALSAILWVERSNEGVWQLQAIHNPAAKYPLPPSAFQLEVSQ
jgi:hypothetical protein